MSEEPIYSEKLLPSPGV